MNNKIHVAFVKFGGLSSGGTQRRLQTLAANLDYSRFEVDYYYCDTAPYIGSGYRHIGTDQTRLSYMMDHGVNLIEFHVGAKDITVPTHDWVDTDFWDIFDEKKYDLVQTAKAGPPEYPFIHMSLPVVEFVALLAGVDHSPNIAWSIHPTVWQWARWCRAGGSSLRSSVMLKPIEPPTPAGNLRAELGIPVDAVVAGFHQRASDEIFSPIPLEAFAQLEQSGRYFVLMGGGQRYRGQARELGLTNIRFLPACADETRISAFLNTLDIFAHGRKDGETFGTVLAEAMMHGKCCLSHRSDIANAQPETMGPGGLFADNAQEYTTYLQRLFTHASLRQKLGTKGKAHAECYYALDGAVRHLESIYEMLTGRSEKAISSNAIYGLTELGYLQAGNITSPASIAHNVMTGGIPEPYDVRLFSFFLPRMRVMLDVGANIGLYCCVAARRAPEGARAYAIEPQPDCCATLKETVRLNNWENRLFIHATAMGERVDTATLYLSGTGSTLNKAFCGNADLPHIEVPVTTLDRFCEEQRLERVDFIKIDVQGGEFAVLRGGENTLARFRPVIYMEMARTCISKNYVSSHFAAILAWLTAHDYAVWRNAGAQGLVPVEDDTPPDGVAMYLCLPQECTENILTTLKHWQREYILARQKQSMLFWLHHMVSKVRRFAGLLLRDPRAACRKLLPSARR